MTKEIFYEYMDIHFVVRDLPVRLRLLIQGKRISAITALDVSIPSHQRGGQRIMRSGRKHIRLH